jgi:hypothetical protein
MVPRLGNDRFLSNPFQFILHTDIVVKWLAKK